LLSLECEEEAQRCGYVIECVCVILQLDLAVSAAVVAELVLFTAVIIPITATAATTAGVVVVVVGCDLPPDEGETEAECSGYETRFEGR
jgi:hypothetical protein